MNGDSPYDLALTTALRVISKLDERPLMSRQAKLATVTYDLLDAINAAVERERFSGSRLPTLAAGDAVTVRCHLVPEHGERAEARRPSPALPPPG